MSKPDPGRIAAAWAALRGKPLTRATLRDTDGWLVQALVGAQNASGQSVTPKSALGLTAFFACIRNISDDLSKTPIRMVEERKGGTFSAVNAHHALTLVADNPNPMMTPMDFWGTIIAHSLGWQGGFAEIVRNQFDEPVEMWPLDPTTVKVVWDNANKTLIYEIRSDGEFFRLFPRDMFHIHGLGFDGFTSFVMADIARIPIGRALATQEHSAAYFGNGATLRGLLEAPPTLTEAGMALLRDTFSMRHAGAGNAYKTPILPDGVTYKEITTDPEKSQLIAAMHAGVEDMARLFRMPLAKIQHDIRSTFNNVAEQNKFYAHDTLSGPSKRICEECRSKLLTAPADKNKRFRHDFAELLEADPVSQADVLTKQFMRGEWTPNQLMEKSGRKGVGPEGDKRFVPDNLVSLVSVDKEPPEPEASPAEPPPPEEPKAPAIIEDAVLLSITKLFRHDFRRFSTTEEDKALRAISDNRLSVWAKGFYPKHERFVAQTLTTRYAVLVAALGLDTDVKTLSADMAKEYIRESRARIGAGGRNETTDTADRFAGIMAVRAVEMARNHEVAV